MRSHCPQRETGYHKGTAQNTYVKNNGSQVSHCERGGKKREIKWILWSWNWRLSKCEVIHIETKMYIDVNVSVYSIYPLAMPMKGFGNKDIMKAMNKLKSSDLGF